MCVTVHREYDASTATLAAARRFGSAAVIAALRPSGWDVADSAEIVISEFVTDAVRSGAAHIDLLVGVHQDRLEISVIDDRCAAGRLSVPDPAAASSATEPSTRSRILEALTTHRVASTGGDGRTTSWAELECDPEATALVPCSDPVGTPH